MDGAENGLTSVGELPEEADNVEGGTRIQA
jgi:hypothetical protein